MQQLIRLLALHPQGPMAVPCLSAHSAHILGPPVHGGLFWGGLWLQATEPNSPERQPRAAFMGSRTHRGTEAQSGRHWGPLEVPVGTRRRSCHHCPILGSEAALRTAGLVAGLQTAVGARGRGLSTDGAGETAASQYAGGSTSR